ncbi:MAG: RdgB/HAM1 family non-canonical purine NTP pyrophosphatase [Candidatus Bathyarchaeia archaeon]|jgi:XTP/dITP diphosphohydrolase
MSKRENNSRSFSFKGKVVFFATGNINKFNEACSILSSFGIALGMLRVKGDEIQSGSLKEIAQASAINAYKRCHLPIFVEDAGLFIDVLSGFPGPYAAYVYKTLHNSGILKLMENVKERQAKFQSVIAYCDETLCEPKYFDGESIGEITLTEHRQQGKLAFGFDPIFQPLGSSKSFAEMTTEEKNGLSHRAMAIRKFAQWYKRGR